MIPLPGYGRRIRKRLWEGKQVWVLLPAIITEVFQFFFVFFFHFHTANAGHDAQTEARFIPSSDRMLTERLHPWRIYAMAVCFSRLLSLRNKHLVIILQIPRITLKRLFNFFFKDSKSSNEFIKSSVAYFNWLVCV